MLALLHNGGSRFLLKGQYPIGPDAVICIDRFILKHFPNESIVSMPVIIEKVETKCRKSSRHHCAVILKELSLQLRNALIPCVFD